MRSTTVTQVYTSRRTRSLSLIITAPRLPKLYELPSELIVAILELALFNSKPSTLATISKTIREYVRYILYRSVNLSSPQTIRLFHRTVMSSSNTPVLTHVKKLAVTWVSEGLALNIADNLKEIITACKFLRILAIPSLYNVVPDLSHHHDLTDLTIQALDTRKPLKLHYGSPSLSKTVTHLRFSEPNEGWIPPSAMLIQFTSLSKLSHLQLSRRTNSNEINDVLFANDVDFLLQSLTALKLVVISIFNSAPWLPEDSIRESNIWNTMAEIRDRDRRVVLAIGKSWEWEKESTEALKAGGAISDFWSNAVQDRDIDALQVDD